MSAKRETPWSRDAEESLIGSMLLSSDGRRRGLREVTAADLWLPEHAAIFRAVEALHEAGEAVDPVTVHERLVVDGVANVTRQQLVELEASTPASASVSTYAGIVRRFARARAAIAVGEALVEAGYEADADALDKLAAETSGRLAGGTVHVEVDDLAALWVLDDAEREHPTKPWVIPGCLRAGEVYVLTGTEGGGKALYLRQVGACVASGVHPLTGLAVGMERHRVLYVDLQEDRVDQAAELGKLRRALVDVYEPGWWASVSWPEGVDVLSPVGRRRVESAMEVSRPELVIVGPLVKAYRTPTGQSRYSEDLIDEVTATFDEWMTRYGFGLMIEAHAGNERGADSDWRVRGSSVWRSWPAFSHGLKLVSTSPREAEVVRSRPDRYADRAWPTRLFENRSWRYPWQVSDGDYTAVCRAMGLAYLIDGGTQESMDYPDSEPF